MKFKIMAEAHEGVCSVPEECWGVIEKARDEKDALEQYARIDPQVKWCEDWQCFLMNARKVFAVPN